MTNLSQVESLPIQDQPEATVRITPTSVFIDDQEYAIMSNYKEALEAKSLEDRYTQLLQKYDYLVGDWGYEQLRLKGFYRNDNKKVEPELRIGALEDYLREYCAFGCAYFVLEHQGQPQAYNDKEDREAAKSYSRKRPRRPKDGRRNNRSEAKVEGAKANKPKKKDYFAAKKVEENKAKPNKPKAAKKQNQFVIRQKGEN